MGRKKQERFRQNEVSENIVQPGKENYLKIKGYWNEHFSNDHPIILEAGCGRGEYTVGLAAVYPDQNYVGADIKGSRIWKGSSIANKEGYKNAAFLRTKLQNLTDFFAPNELSEIWVTFPDPRPKEGEEKLRLTSPRFMNMYRNMLKPNGKLHLKTDSILLFEYTLELLQSGEIKEIENLIFTRDLYSDPVLLSQHHGIQTTYEKKFMAEGFKINYLSFNFRK
ncbi:MAG: tRNA (guanosine(46)-N7)-methyltransferase TrmB [Cytophagaceae bacterium]|nr:tRNA (guanosine(46)-N7)-methyltransferase TrmB [Cytophagaceae bacterium]